MKRLTTKILTIAACAAMMLTAVPLANVQSVQAAVKAQGTVNLETKKLSIPKGTSTAITNNTLTMVKGRRYAVKFKIKGKAYSLATLPTTVGKAKVNTTTIASIKNNMLTANKAGTTTFRVVKGSKNLVTLKVKVIDTTAHKHSWKTLTKATCASKGKKLCKTCGATGTTAMSKTHSFKITKKATCETKGVKTCTVCGTKEAIAKTAHEYVTETATYIEGRGKAYYEDAVYCNGCGIDISNWTRNQIDFHYTDIEGMQTGTANWDCFNAGHNMLAGVEKYPKYVKTKTVETYCKHCGAWKDKTNEDLYEVYYDEWRNVVRKSDNKILEESVWYKKAKPYLEKAKELEESKNQGGTATASVKKAAARAVASPQDVITDIPDNTVVKEANVIISADETVSADAIVEEIIAENKTISDNAVSEDSVSENSVSENEINGAELNTTITDPNQGGDFVFEDTDSIVIENREDSDGIVIETVDDTDDDIVIEDIDDTDDYDGSEGEVTEDE